VTAPLKSPINSFAVNSPVISESPVKVCPFNAPLDSSLVPIAFAAISLLPTAFAAISADPTAFAAIVAAVTVFAAKLVVVVI